ncbi:IclR family transcriptional regulator [Desulfotomaculum copahuensis]|uniref:Glycerol operon regulatory protein n=1 Tax=Desulfotomaculum copahuensis TaxID=1838280 RepID=A0A1B7LJ01_9FIRM|nr:IclR family transcriptional regulator [Desulfotomaculum copahuensis]OAT86544.1 IclR family transcriptional regulator [Desulfotomaculum copahuensis]
MPANGQMKTAEGTQIRSVAKALMIIDYMASVQGELPLAKIAARLGMAKSTAHGLLATLKDFGYIEQSPFTGNYKLGMRLFEIGNIVGNSLDVRTVAVPYIQQLVGEIEETVHLAVLDKGEVLYIDKRESHQSLRIVSQVGMRLPAHCTGVGKALLAYLPESELKRVIAAKGLPRYTKQTITEAQKLGNELRQVKERGYAVDNEEIMDSLRCVAAPVFDHSGRACAAISVSGPVARLAKERFELAVTSVTRAAADISAALGYRPAAVGSDLLGT